MPAKRQVYNFRFFTSVSGPAALPKAPVSMPAIRQSLKGFEGKEVRMLKVLDNDTVELGAAVGSVVYVRDDERGTVAAVALDANISPAHYVLEPLYQAPSPDDKAVPHCLALRPATGPSPTAYFALELPETTAGGQEVAPGSSEGAELQDLCVLSPGASGGGGDDASCSCASCGDGECECGKEHDVEVAL